MKSRPLKRVLLYVFLAILCVLYAAPIVSVITTSIKRPVDAFSFPPKLIFMPTLEHYFQAWGRGSPFGLFVANSGEIALSSAALTLVLACPAAYGFVLWRGKVALAVLLALLSVRMFPQMLMAIPYYVSSLALHVYDTQILLMALYTAFELPFAIWMLRGFFETLPPNVDEAAMVDGCSRMGALWRVLIPNIATGLVATFFLVFLFAWNEYLFAFLLTSTNARTMPAGITSYFRAERLEWWSWAAAGVTGYLIPSVAIVVAIQKYLVKGLTFGLVKS